MCLTHSSSDKPLTTVAQTSLEWSSDPRLCCCSRQCCFPPWLNQTLTLLPTCAHWTLLMTRVKICCLESINFTALCFSELQNIFSFTTQSQCWWNVTASLPNVQISTDTNVWVGSIELSQREPAEWHAAGAWYSERVQRNNCTALCWADISSIRVISGPWHLAVCLLELREHTWEFVLGIETPFCAQTVEHIAGHATRSQSP